MKTDEIKWRILNDIESKDKRIQELEADKSLLDALLSEVEFWYEKLHHCHKNIDSSYCRMKVIQLCEDRGYDHGLTPELWEVSEQKDD